MRKACVEDAQVWWSPWPTTRFWVLHTNVLQRGAYHIDGTAGGCHRPGWVLCLLKLESDLPMLLERCTRSWEQTGSSSHSLPPVTAEGSRWILRCPRRSEKSVLEVKLWKGEITWKTMQPSEAHCLELGDSGHSCRDSCTR